MTLHQGRQLPVEYTRLMHSRDRFAFVAAIRLGMSSTAAFSLLLKPKFLITMRRTHGSSRRGFDYVIFTRQTRKDFHGKCASNSLSLCASCLAVSSFSPNFDRNFLTSVYFEGSCLIQVETKVLKSASLNGRKRAKWVLARLVVK